MQYILVVEVESGNLLFFEKVRIWSLWCDFYGKREADFF